MTGNEHRIHTSERTREGTCAAQSSSESIVRSNCRSICSIAALTTGSSGRILAAWSHCDVRSRDAATDRGRVRQQRLDPAPAPRQRTESRTDTSRSRIRAAASGSAWRSVSATSCRRRSRRAQDQVEERGDARGERRRQHRLDVRVDVRLVEFSEHVAREALDAEAEHPESGAPHRRQALGRHRIDAVGADELQLARDVAALAWPRRSPRTAAGSRLIAGEGEDVVLKDDRAGGRLRPRRSARSCAGTRRHRAARVPPTLPWASCRKLVAEQKVQAIGQ